jgi:uroporphyrinogen decarboxylase
MQIKPAREPWKGTMSGRERFAHQMHHRSVDRCFNREFGYWDDNFREWRIFAENKITNNADADLFFSFDPMPVFSGTIWMSPAFEEKVIRETETTRILINEHGLLAEVPKDGHSTIPHYLEASIKTPEDWKRVKEQRFRRDDPARRIDVEALRSRHPADRDYPLGVSCGSMIGRIRDMLTFEGLAYAIYDYPDMLEDMVETACVLVEDMLDQVLGRIDFDFASGWEDICFKSGPIVSLDFFRKVLVPRYKRIGTRLKAAGIDIWYTDCDGDIRPLVPGWLEAGLNTMFPFEVNSSGHPADLLAEYGPELRIMGGVDKMALGAGREAIRSYLETLEPLVAEGGYIPHCDHRCPPNVREEDYLYYLDLKERMFGLTG